jgi:hypothetical protein
MNQSNGITEVLSGTKPLQLNVTMDTQSLILLGVTVFIAVMAALLISKNI